MCSGNGDGPLRCTPSEDRRAGGGSASHRTPILGRNLCSSVVNICNASRWAAFVALTLVCLCLNSPILRSSPLFNQIQGKDANGVAMKNHIANKITGQSAKNDYDAAELVDILCSYLPESVQNLAFPLHMAKTSGVDKPADLKTKPLIWLFDSGVMLKTEYLTHFQLGRFWQKNQENAWEVVDEPLIMKAVGDLYHRCVLEDCVFVDGGAAFGYYTQMIRINFPLVKVLAFNPHPTFVRQMLDNLAVSRVTGGICLQQKGLSDAIGMAKIDYGVGGHLGAANGVDVPVVTLDDYYEDFGKDKLVVAIKLDVEGNGGKALRGAQQMINVTQNIFVGLHNQDESDECNELVSRGLTLLEKSKFPMGKTPNGLCVATRNRNW